MNITNPTGIRTRFSSSSKSLSITLPTAPSVQCLIFPAITHLRTDQVRHLLNCSDRTVISTRYGRNPDDNENRKLLNQWNVSIEQQMSEIAISGNMKGPLITLI